MVVAGVDVGVKVGDGAGVPQAETRNTTDNTEQNTADPLDSRLISHLHLLSLIKLLTVMKSTAALQSGLPAGASSRGDLSRDLSPHLSDYSTPRHRAAPPLGMPRSTDNATPVLWRYDCCN